MQISQCLDCLSLFCSKQINLEDTKKVVGHENEKYCCSKFQVGFLAAHLLLVSSCPFDLSPASCRLVSGALNKSRWFLSGADGLDKTWSSKDKRLGAAAVTLIQRQDKSDSAAEESGFIGISQRLNGTLGLLSLFHTEQTLSGGG